MKLSEALAQLPPDMIMMDLSAIGLQFATAGELLERAQRRDGDGFEVREERRVPGRRWSKTVGVIGGGALYRQRDSVEREQGDAL